ncbi:hypothetical protein H0A66_02605 [Alcaligenaceae bacterium]|nr:hypothetical protein [Alcaligenaceae bacterium]
MKIHFWVMKAACVRKIIVSRVPALMLGVLLLPAFQACHALPVQAAQAAEARLAALEASPLRWGEAQLMHLSGVPVYIKSFSSPGLAVRAAQSLAVHADVFQRVLTVKNKIVLSGLASGWHWLAEIDSMAQGAGGYVSALYLEAAGASSADSNRASPYKWLPAYARKQFGQNLEVKSQTVAQHIYSVALSPQDLATHLDKSLRDDGWASEPTLTDMAGASAWRRNQARLLLFPYASADGTSLFVHLAE